MHMRDARIGWGAGWLEVMMVMSSFAVLSCGDDSSPAGCVELTCGSHGSCSEATDAGTPGCACDEGYAGAACDRCATGYEESGSSCVESQAGSECAVDSCSANGACDDTTGEVVCECDEGFAGDSCADCDDGYHEAEGTCVEDETCQANSCPNNASCDASSGAIECECDDGWGGDACDECAAGFHDDAGDCVEDTQCAARTCANGTCEDASGVPVCSCSGGWSGEHCDECGDGHHQDGSECVEDETCALDSCSANAECDDTTGAIVCECLDGFTGDDCEECLAPLVMDETGACVEDVTECELGLSLNEAGECTLACDDESTVVDTAGVDPATLPVPDGYELLPPSTIVFPDGSTLEVRSVGTLVCLPLGFTCDQFDPCGGNAAVGVCEDQSGLPACVCNTGYAGLVCTECAPGYHADGEECVIDATCPATPCTGRGTCDDSSGEALCTCEAGYEGAACEACVSGYHSMDDGSCALDEVCVDGVCGDHGSCQVTAGVAGCNCFVGYTGEDCSTCTAGYHAVGDACAADETCASTSCSDAGQCDDSSSEVVCTCDLGYAGANCEVCDDGYTRANGICVALDDGGCNGGTCNGRGTCDDSSGTAICDCVSPWSGGRCTTCARGFLKVDGACVPSVCGDLVTDPRIDEECDDGVPAQCSTDPGGALCQAGNTNSCTNQCLFNVCGDGFPFLTPQAPAVVNSVGSGHEEKRRASGVAQGAAPPEKNVGDDCDDGPGNTDQCVYGEVECLVCLPPGEDEECTVAVGVARRCGDGVVDADEGEACDNGALNGDCYQPDSDDSCVDICDSSCQVSLVPVTRYCGDDRCDSEEAATCVDCSPCTGVSTVSATPGLAIPDATVGCGPTSPSVGITHTIAGPAGAAISKVEVDLNITHTFVGDLKVVLSHNGTDVTLIERMGTTTSCGCGHNNLAITLDDFGTGAIESQCTANLSSPPSYTPNAGLAAFAGMSPSGDWTLTVSDNAAIDTGTLVSWGLRFTCGAL
jgi:subtilisin-like proprotein convertase family protein